MKDETLNAIKLRVGVPYSTPEKDGQITSLIMAAQATLQKAGWPEASLDSDQALDAIAIQIKMGLDEDPDKMKINPMWLALIGQNRGEEETEDNSK